jgi:hypothetical protein
MQDKNFEEIVKKEFKFLESKFEFKLYKSKEEDWGYKIIYLNKTTGVKITYEYRESYLFIMLYRLVDGKIVENPRNINEETTLFGYALDDIIKLHNPSALIGSTYKYSNDSKCHDKENGMSYYISDYARNLEKYAKDVLTGDFTIFPSLDKLVKERAEKYK